MNPPRWKRALITWLAMFPIVGALAHAIAPLRLPLLATIAISILLADIMLWIFGGEIYQFDPPRWIIGSTTLPIVGKSIREGEFRTRYDAVVIAVHRNGERIDRRIGATFPRWLRISRKVSRTCSSSRNSLFTSES